MNNFIRRLQRKMGFEHWVVLSFFMLGIGNIIGGRPGIQEGILLELSGWYMLVGSGVILIDNLFKPKFMLKRNRKSLIIPIAWFILAAGLLAAGVVTVVWYAYIPWSIACVIRALWLNAWYRSLKEDDN